jgi:hypothetical protein
LGDPVLHAGGFGGSTPGAGALSSETTLRERAATTKRSIKFVSVVMRRFSLVFALSSLRPGVAFGETVAELGDAFPVGGPGNGSGSESAPASAQFADWRPMGAKGPGLSAAAADKLAWTVPRTVDLSYVNPANFAAPRLIPKESPS